MNQKLIKTAEVLEIDIKGKSELELMEEVAKAMSGVQASVEETSKQELIDNGTKRVSELKTFFDKPFEIWAEKVGKGKKPECLPVVGYNTKISSIIVAKKTIINGEQSFKLYPVKDELIITSVSKLDELNPKKSTTKKTGTKTGTKKPKK
jgi:hypothetical protein